MAEAADPEAAGNGRQRRNPGYRGRVSELVARTFSRENHLNKDPSVRSRFAMFDIQVTGRASWLNELWLHTVLWCRRMRGCTPQQEHRDMQTAANRGCQCTASLHYVAHSIH